MDVAAEDRKAAMFGLYSLLRDMIVSAAALGGAFVWQIGSNVNFLVAFSCGLCAQYVLHFREATCKGILFLDGSANRGAYACRQHF